MCQRNIALASVVSNESSAIGIIIQRTETHARTCWPQQRELKGVEAEWNQTAKAQYHVRALVGAFHRNASVGPVEFGEGDMAALRSLYE